MEKEFVPYPLALRMKALGFKERVLTYFEDDKIKLHDHISGWDFNSSFLNCISRPTYSQAFRWFREKYNMNGYVSPLEDGKSFYYMLHEDISVTYGNRICSLPSKWLSHEEAELACLEKLIEIEEERNNERNKD